MQPLDVRAGGSLGFESLGGCKFLWGGARGYPGLACFGAFFFSGLSGDVELRLEVFRVSGLEAFGLRAIPFRS